MKLISVVIILFSYLPMAFGAYPRFVKPHCVLGLTWKVDQADDKQVMSLYHADNLFKLTTFNLTSQKKYYLIILENEKAPQQTKINVKPEVASNGEISCQVTKIFGSKSLTTNASKNANTTLPISAQLFDLCYSQIFDATFAEIPVCE